MTDAVPFKIYNARNASKKEAFVYLGKASKKGFNGYDRDYFAHQYEQGCQAVFILATVTGTRNIKVHKPTEANPYLVLQTKDYKGLDRNGETEEAKVDATSVYRRTEVDLENANRVIRLRTFKTDESMEVIPYENEYDLKTWKYDFKNVCVSNGFYYKRHGIPSKSHVKFFMKQIIGDGCITVDANYTDNYIRLVLDPLCCNVEGACTTPTPVTPSECSWSPTAG